MQHCGFATRWSEARRLAPRGHVTPKLHEEGAEWIRTFRHDDYHVFLSLSDLSLFKSTREGRSPLRMLRVERQIVFQLFLREWDSKFP